MIVNKFLGIYIMHPLRQFPIFGNKKMWQSKLHVLLYLGVHFFFLSLDSLISVLISKNNHKLNLGKNKQEMLEQINWPKLDDYQNVSNMHLTLMWNKNIALCSLAEQKEKLQHKQNINKFVPPRPLRIRIG